jgi:prepilin-type N-terminal cleavage/methylation domain-containing protein
MDKRAAMAMMPTLSVGKIDRGARTRECRVDILVDTVDGGRQCSHECEHGTHECVRHNGHSNRNYRDRGVTLLELLVVVALIALMAGIAFPAITSGIDSLRLNAATNAVVNFLNSALDRAERRQQVVEITVSKSGLEMRSTVKEFERKLALPDGVTITHVLPELEDEDPTTPRTFVLYPGGTVPGFGIELINRRKAERIVRVDPITGVPRVERPEQ